MDVLGLGQKVLATFGSCPRYYYFNFRKEDMMLLTVFAYAMMVVFMYVIMKKKMSPFTALVLIPLAFALVAVLTGVVQDVNIGNNEKENQIIKSFCTFRCYGNHHAIVF